MNEILKDGRAFLDIVDELKFQTVSDVEDRIDKNFLVKNFYPIHYLETSCCGKLILSGEHAVVYGSYAVATPIRNLRFRLKLYVLDKNEDCDRKGCKEDLILYSNSCDIDIHKNIFSIFKKALSLLSIDSRKYRGFILVFNSDFPLKAGLGGSAAISSSIVELLSKLVSIELDVKEKIRISNELERINHLNPSGVDVSTIIYETPIIYKKGGLCSQITVNKDKNFNFLLVDTLEKSSTSEMILKAQPFFKQGGVKLLDRFDELSLIMKNSLETKDLDKISYSINETASLLEKASLFTESIKYICTKSLELGALASKPSGACGGGVVIILLDPEKVELEDNLLDILNKFKVFKFSI